MRRIWLHNVGVFEIIPNSGKGSCLFKAVSQALTLSMKHHYKIRSDIVDHMTCDRWAERLSQLPNFWKHKIIVKWLNKEQDSFLQQRDTFTFNNHLLLKILTCCKLRWVQRFVERRRHRKYNRIKELLNNKSKLHLHGLDDFKFVFKKFMLQADEPGTRFELEAAADKFRFHFDYLQTIPMSKRALNYHTQKRRISKDDIENNNNLIIDTQDEPMKPSQNIGCKNKDGTITLVPVKMAMHQFHSCRNRGCKFPRSCPTYEHFYFLHSPMEQQNSCMNANTQPFDSSASEECWHWELLLPIFIRKNPVPLNRRIFGLSYEINDSARRFTMGRNIQSREIEDTVAEAIETFVRKNPEIIPSEDSQWPADDIDDYSGCAKSLKESFYYHANLQEHDAYSSSSRRVVANRDYIVDNVNE